MLLVIGQVIRPHGIRGEVVVELRTDDPAARFSPDAILLTDHVDVGLLTVEYARPHTVAGKQRLLVAFAEVPDRDAAEALRGVLLRAEADELAPLDDPDEFYDQQLIGLTVCTRAGEVMGEVVRVNHGSAQDHLVVRRPGAKDALVPFVTAIVPEVDLAGGRVVVTPPGGLFDV